MRIASSNWPTRPLSCSKAEGPSGELVSALAEWLWLFAGEGDCRRTLATAERGLALASSLALSTDPRLIAARGCARCDLGDAGGVDDLKDALEVCRSSGDNEYLSAVFIEVANWIYLYEGFRAALDIGTEGLARARRRGAIDDETYLRTTILWACESAGEWDRVLDEAVALEPLVEAAGDAWPRSYVRLFPSLVLVDTGRAAEAAGRLEWLEEAGLGELLWLDSGLSIAAAAVRMALGDQRRALSHLVRCETGLRSPGGFWWAVLLPRAVRIALAGGDRALAERLVGSIEPLQPLSRHAVATGSHLLAEA